MSSAVKLEACVDGESAFTLVLDDPAGNSYIETPAESHEKDPLLRLEHYERTPEQAEGIGLLPPEPAGNLSPSNTHLCIRCVQWTTRRQTSVRSVVPVEPSATFLHLLHAAEGHMHHLTSASCKLYC